MGGLILSQVFTLYTTPVIYVGLDRAGVKLREWMAELFMAPKFERRCMNTRNLKWCLTGCLGALLAGCMVGPDYHRPSAPVPAQYKELPGWTAAAPADGAPKGDWWTEFHDPLLDQLEPMVAVSNQTVRQRLRELPTSAGRGESRARPIFSDARHHGNRDPLGRPRLHGYRRRERHQQRRQGLRRRSRARRVGHSTCGGRCAA